MTNAQKKNLAMLLRRFRRDFRKKYAAGSREHKETLSTLPPLTLLEYALEENLDQFAYLCTAIELLRAKKR